MRERRWEGRKQERWWKQSLWHEWGVQREQCNSQYMTYSAQPGCVGERTLSPLSSHTITVSAFTCTLESSFGYSSIRPFNWTTVPVPVYKNQGTMDLLTYLLKYICLHYCRCMTPFSGLLFRPSFGWPIASQPYTSNKHVSKKLAPYLIVKTWTTLQHSIFPAHSLLILYFFKTPSSCFFVVFFYKVSTSMSKTMWELWTDWGAYMQE